MYLVGLTGGIATGKSTVSSMFSELGVPVVDADVIARKVVQPGKKAWKKIREIFGSEVLEHDGEINRQILGGIIFNDPSKRSELNRITHPEIYKEICWEIIHYFLRGYQFVIIDSPLLFEAKAWTSYIHKSVVVTCEDDLQLQRLMDRSNLRESEAKARVAAQMPMKEKCAKADYVIENSSNLQDTKDQVLAIYGNLRESRFHWKIRLIVGLLGFSSVGVVGLFFWLIRKWATYRRLIR